MFWPLSCLSSITQSFSSFVSHPACNSFHLCLLSDALLSTIFLSQDLCRGRLHPLHCCIIPTEHMASSRKVDEHVWTEMRNFKKCVIQMNAQQVAFKLVVISSCASQCLNQSILFSFAPMYVQ